MGHGQTCSLGCCVRCTSAQRYYLLTYLLTVKENHHGMCVLGEMVLRFQQVVQVGDGHGYYDMTTNRRRWRWCHETN